MVNFKYTLSIICFIIFLFISRGDSTSSPHSSNTCQDFNTWQKFMGGEIKVVKNEHSSALPGELWTLQAEGSERHIGFLCNQLNINVSADTIVEFDWKSSSEIPLESVAFSVTKMGNENSPYWLFNGKSNVIFDPARNIWHHAVIPLVNFKNLKKKNIEPGDKIIGFGVYETQGRPGQEHTISIANFKIYNDVKRAACQISKIENWTSQAISSLRPLVTVPFVNVPKTGTYNSASYKNMVEFQCLPDKYDMRLNEETCFYIEYDQQNVYITAIAQQAYLDPVLNKLDEIKSHAIKRDDPVYYDDSIEFFIVPGNGSLYQFVINMDGVIYDSKDRDKEWNSAINASVTKMNRSWTAEISIPLSDFGETNELNGKTWRGNFYRNNPARKEYSAWSPTGGKAFCMAEYFGYLIFKKETPLIQCKDLKITPSNAKMNLSISTKEDLILIGASDPDIVLGPKTTDINITVEADEKASGQLCILKKNSKDTIFRTPAIPLSKEEKDEITATVMSPGNDIELYLDGHIIAAGKDKLNIKTELKSTENVIGLKVSGSANTLSGTFSTGELSFPISSWICCPQEESGWLNSNFNDEKWKLFPGKKEDGTLFLRHVLIKDHTKFAPQLDDNTLFIANNAALHVGIQRDSPFETKALHDYKVHLELPAQIKIPLYEPQKRKLWDYKENVHNFNMIASQDYNKFIFSYKFPIPKLRYEGGVYNTSMVISANFPEEMEGRTLKGKCYITGKGLHEIPYKFNIKILPSLKGKAPKNSIFRTCFNWPGSRLSLKEMESLLFTNVNMGMNLVALDSLYFGSKNGTITEQNTFSQIEHFIGAAHAAGLKTTYILGIDNPAFSSDLYRINPEWQAVTCPEKVEWEKYVCPMVFMSSKEICARIKKLAELNDRLELDIEYGIGGVCFCPNCKGKITKNLQIPENTPNSTIKNKFKNYLVESQLDMNMRIFDFFKTTAKAENPRICCDIVSAYEINSTKEVYGIKWETYKNIVDMPIAGYGEDSKLIRKTRSALENRPMMVGFMLDSGISQKGYFKDPYDAQNIKARLFKLLVDSGFGGLNLFTFEELNGIGQTAFADLTRGISMYEEFFLEKNEIPNNDIVTGISSEFIHVYRKGSAYICAVVNLIGIEKNISLSPPTGTNDVYDYYGNRHFYVNGNKLGFTIAPNDILLLYIK